MSAASMDPVYKVLFKALYKVGIPANTYNKTFDYFNRGWPVSGTFDRLYSLREPSIVYDWLCV